MVKRIEDLINKMRDSPKNVRFTELEKVCDHFFEKRRSQGTSHRTYKTPWVGDPRVNIQNDGGKAKPYQVHQVLQAVEKLQNQNL
ncbi:toxin HicA [Corynebacterium crudilactis]|uniref:Toxin HicA n=1 Tax=Corynebacterium crudilactis TaxID=1652495 RepID=A0A172QTJ3_9CORY|nr:toxin HicA [Corynebacterium crudilactis]ANE04012.1 toxin HicA [Corynebacterium crudilactis]